MTTNVRVELFDPADAVVGDMVAYHLIASASRDLARRSRSLCSSNDSATRSSDSATRCTGSCAPRTR